ncbi:hypothetical protein BGZ98_003379 [Dissophora globulifera]|nr:hypothetical protein BGZ98_003379 [Dissophora globulifera]
MGILKLACTASDSNSVWGLTITNNYSTPYFAFNSERYYAIVKSNANPTRNVSDLTWSLISAISIDVIRPISATDSEHYCAVNSNGVFTVFYTYIPFESYTSSISAPAGFQYDPSVPHSSASYNQTLQIGSGVWSGLTVDPAFVWPTYLCKPSLFYAGGNASSTPSLVLAYFDSNLNEGISFASLNESTKTLSFMGSWASS